MSMAELRDYLTIPQVAKLLRRDQATVNRYIKKGYLQAERIAGRYLIERSQLATFEHPQPGNPNLKRHK
jgi:excisionase family DNA binding protein